MGDHADDAINQAMDEWLDRMDLCDDDDDDDEPSLRRRRFVRTGPDEWVRDGEAVKIKELNPTHLCGILNYIARRGAAQKIGGEKMIRLRGQARKLGCVKDSATGEWHYAPGRVDARDDFSTVM